MSALRLLFAEMHRPPESIMPCVVHAWYKQPDKSTLIIVPLVTYMSDEMLLDLPVETLLPILRRNAETRA